MQPVSSHRRNGRVVDPRSMTRQGESTVSVDGNLVIDVIFGSVDDEPAIRINIEGVDISIT